MTTPEHSRADASSLHTDPDNPRSERLRRPEPQRTGPIRNASGYFRESGSWGQEERPAWREPAEVLDDVVTQGVKLGYRVIDEHLRQGRRAAATLRGGEEAQSGDRELEQWIEKVQRVYKDLGTLCFDALDVMTRSPALLRRLAGSGAGTDTQKRADDRPAPAAFAIEVAASRRVRVNLHLPPDADPYVPAVHALHAGDPGCPPLVGTTFRTDSACAVPVLVIEVPDRQPPGLYTGVVVDRASNEPKGTLSVRILD